MIDKVRGTASIVFKTSNRVKIPKTESLGMGDFFKQLLANLGRDHTGTFAAALVYKG